VAPFIGSLFSGIRPLAVSGPEAVSLLRRSEISRITAHCVDAETVRHRANDGLCPAGAVRSTPLRSSFNCSTQCYRMTSSTLRESSSPGGFSASRKRRELRTRSCSKLRIALTRARSTPTWVARSSSNGSPDVGREGPAATGRSSSSGGEQRHSLYTGFPRASGPTSMPMSCSSLGKLQSTSWR